MSEELDKQETVANDTETESFPPVDEILAGMDSDDDDRDATTNARIKVRCLCMSSTYFFA